LKKDKIEKYNIPIRSDVIILFTSLCFSKNNNILLKDFISLKNFLDVVDTDAIQININNFNSMYYFELIHNFLDLRLTKKIKNTKFILGKILDESPNKDIFSQIINTLDEISNDDIFLVRNFLIERLRYLHLYSESETLEELLLDIKTNNFNSLEDISKKYEQVIKQHFSVLNKTKSDQGEILNDLPLDSEGISTLASDLHTKLNQEGSVISSGIAEMDKLFKATRGELTLLGGPSGGFKSGTMLNMFFNTKLYNPNLSTNDPTKKPLVLYISMENTQKITFSRAIKLILNKNRAEVKDTDPEIIAKEFNDKLNSFPTGSKDTQLKLMYYPSNTISVSDLYGIIEEEEHNGFEVVAIYVDYIKTLKPEAHSRGLELRMQLSNNSRSLADLAVVKDIAVVSAFQLNRGAIEAHTINATHIQEAFSIMDHADNTVFLRKVYSPTLQNSFLQLFEGKLRSNEDDTLKGNNDIFAPFDINNSFRIQPTLHEKNPFIGKTIDIKLPNSGNATGNRVNTKPSNSAPLVPPIPGVVQKNNSRKPPATDNNSGSIFGNI